MSKNNVKTISVDFDGVLLGLFMGRVWRSTEKDHNKLFSKYVPVGIERLFMSINHLLRSKIVGSQAGLMKLKSRCGKLYLVTSRSSRVKGLTIKWLSNNDMYDSFDNLIFNEKEEVPSLFKEKALKNWVVDVHIDDDMEAVDYLSRKLPDTKFILFGQNYVKSTLKGRENVYLAGDWNRVIDIIDAF